MIFFFNIPFQVDLQKEFTHHDLYEWLETHREVEENKVQNLLKDPKRDINRHICVDLVRRVIHFYIFMLDIHTF